MFIGDISNGLYKAIYNVWGAPPCEDLSIPHIFGISSAAGEYKQQRQHFSFVAEHRWTGHVLSLLSIMYIGSPLLIIYDYELYVYDQN